MLHFFVYALLGIFLGYTLPAAGQPAPKKTKGKIVQKKAPSPLKKEPKKKDASKKQDIKPADPTPVKDAVAPEKLRPLEKKTIVIDARRLHGHKFTEIIRYIKEHPNLRLKLQSMTIDADSVVPLMKGFKDANVIDQIRDIGFVMLPGPNNQVLNEQAFIQKVLPYLGHLEGIELSCLGVTDKVVAAMPKMMPHLKALSLFGIGITDVTVTTLIKDLPDLVKIHLINTSLTVKGIQALVKNFPYLRALGISGQNLKDQDFEAIKQEATTLYSFSLVGQTFKDMKTFAHLLENMPKLHTLDLSETNATDQVAKGIPLSIKSLDISETPITPAGVKDIVKRLDLTTLKMNKLNHIGADELNLITQNQPGLKKFHCAGANLDDATVMKLVLKLKKLTDVTLIPADDSSWMMTESIAEALAHKEVKLHYLRIPARRLTEILRAKLQRDIPHLRLEYEE